MRSIPTDKIAHVIIRAREYESGVNPWAHSGHRTGHGVGTELHEFIAGLNDDEQAALTAVMWIGRDSFDAEELDEAIATAISEKSVPTEDYLMGEPRLADYLEAGLEALGISPEDAEDDLQHPV
jgi:Xaa-Pro aminopeptidase